MEDQEKYLCEDILIFAFRKICGVSEYYVDFNNSGFEIVEVSNKEVKLEGSVAFKYNKDVTSDFEISIPRWLYNRAIAGKEYFFSWATICWKEI